MSPLFPANLDPGQRVTVSFEYETTADGGVRIFVRPLTDGELSSGYRAHGSPLYPEGTGDGRGYFYFDSEATVDQIRIQMWNADQSELLYQRTITVDYTWTN